MEKEKELTPPPTGFLWFLVGVGVVVALRFFMNSPTRSERTESIREFLLNPDKYEIHEIYRDSVLINYEIICK